MEYWRFFTITVFGILGIAVVYFAGVSNSSQPLLPFQLENHEWCKVWLKACFIDWGLILLCISAIVIATEGWMCGGIWALAMGIIGGPIFSTYIIYKLIRGSSLKIE